MEKGKRRNVTMSISRKLHTGIQAFWNRNPLSQYLGSGIRNPIPWIWNPQRRHMGRKTELTTSIYRPEHQNDGAKPSNIVNKNL